jgi:hypothetical protein
VGGPSLRPDVSQSGSVRCGVRSCQVPAERRLSPCLTNPKPQLNKPDRPLTVRLSHNLSAAISFGSMRVLSGPPKYKGAQISGRRQVPSGSVGPLPF